LGGLSACRILRVKGWRVWQTNRQGADIKRLVLASAILFAASTGLAAEQAGAGDPQAGFLYAKEVCANCHAISDYSSPVPAATAFDQIAIHKSAEALFEWMHSTHPTMPNITLKQEDLDDVIAYILSLKADGQSGDQ
jgi:mono/diheme cytochrome c family protein